MCQYIGRNKSIALSSKPGAASTCNIYSMVTSELSRQLAVPHLAALLSLSRERGCSVYMVGGYLRDFVMGRQTSYPDYDFIVQGGKAIELAQEFACRLSGNFVVLDEAFDTARVVLSDCQFDFAGCMGATLEDDLHRRDYTINALAWNPLQPESLIDTVGALTDIRNQTVRLISPEAVNEDPLRILRAWRFAAALNFTIDDSTRAVLTDSMSSIGTVTRERVSYELFALFESDCAAVHVKDMGETGLLEKLFPELKNTRQVTANSFHHLGLFDHSVEAVRQCEVSFTEFPQRARELFTQPLAHTLTRFGALKIACLLHDIGKPETWIVTPEGKHTFIGHDKLGAEMCAPLAKRMKWSKPLERFVEKMIRWHLRPGQLFHQGDPTDRAIVRFYRSIGEDVPELILLAMSDFRSTCGPGLQEGRGRAERKLIELLERYFVYVDEAKHLPRLLDGKDVMSILGISGSPIVGTILEALEEARQLGEIVNRQQAEEFVRTLYAEKYSK